MMGVKPHEVDQMSMFQLASIIGGWQHYHSTPEQRVDFPTPEEFYSAFGMTVN